MNDQELLLALRQARTAIARAMVPVEDAYDEMAPCPRKEELKAIIASTDLALANLFRLTGLMARGGVP